MGLRDPEEYGDLLDSASVDLLTEASTLSKREVECLKLRKQGYTDEEIAEELGIGEGTVSSYVNRANKKADLAKKTVIMVLEADQHIQTSTLSHTLKEKS